MLRSLIPQSVTFREAEVITEAIKFEEYAVIHDMSHVFISMQYGHRDWHAQQAHMSMKPETSQYFYRARGIKHCQHQGR